MCPHLSQAGCRTAVLIFCACLLSMPVSAQQRSATAEPDGGARQRPAPMNANVGVSPEMEKILQTWEQKSGSVNRMKGDFTRFEYDKVFATAKCAIGRYWYESPDKGRMDFTPDNKVVATPPKTVVKGDVTFTLQPDDARTWICDGEKILDIDIVKKEYNQIKIPPQFQGKNISDGPLPFLFGMKADKLKDRYVLEMGALNNPAKIIHIVAYPKLPAEQREYRVAEVLLDPVEFLPQAVQLLDPTGNKQTVYMFTKHDKPAIPFLPPGPWHPPLISFTKVHDEEAAPQMERESKQQDGILIR
ncbi:hypothetical protein [Planctomicrobium piriforme]|uniref:TIGR03009 family protein n=1 Tax=Planctomicrobium piriforme TaxID=1576369 RepID=A0A1I3GWC1_9PLAN|nr:hypothetical protein [Planctomicrobium piriforme]SFI27885.1 TIGR03009 family protein [Planctomicrobium piriforme]